MKDLFQMRYFVAFISVVVIGSRAIWRDLKFDDISLTLFIIAAIALLVPDIGGLINRVRKIKHGGTEIELDKAVSKLTQDVEEIELSEPEQLDSKYITTAYSPKLAEKIASSGKDPRAALLLLSVELEKSIRELNIRENLPEKAPLLASVLQLVNKGILSTKLAEMFGDYWRVRNTIAHGTDQNINSETLYAMIELGMNLLKFIPSKETYYVNKNAQANGVHDVHKEGCAYGPAPENRLFLGYFYSCHEAIAKAKAMYLHVDGCYYCMPTCHTN